MSQSARIISSRVVEREGEEVRGVVVGGFCRHEKQQQQQQQSSVSTRR
jgi:hypothetical protein